MSVGKRLREVRSAIGLSQTVFAELGNVTKRAQINFELDENVPNSAYVLALHAAGIDTHYILTGLHGAMTAEEDALLVCYRRADEVGKAMMMGVAGPKADKGGKG